jgi:hypothetical protein
MATLEQVLGRIGVTLVKTEPGANRLIAYFRVDPKKQDLWNETVSEFLLASIEPPAKSAGWSVDVSKWFYPTNGAVRFLWRIVLIGNPQAAGEALGRAASRAVSSGVEVTSQPLVGRKTFEYDPARGKIGGAHSMDTAAGLLERGLSR